MPRLIHITDTHLSPRQGFFFGNFARVTRAINSERADLVVNTGDLSINGAEIEDDLAFARHCHREIATPVRFVPGNHDVGEEPEALHLDQPIDGERLARYRQTFGADWWTTPLGSWQLIGLNALLMGSGLEDEARQWRWLEDILATVSDRPLGLFIHKPLFLTAPNEPADPAVALGQASRDQLLAAFAGRSLRFVCSGHLHQRRAELHEDVLHVWGPSTAFPTSAPRPGAEASLGYAVLELAIDGHAAVRFEEPSGVIRHDYMALKENGRYPFLKDIPPGRPPIPWPL